MKKYNTDDLQRILLAPTPIAEEGGATRVLKLRQIEPEFLERMFSVEDV